MPYLNLRPSPKAVRNYYTALKEYGQLRLVYEGAVAPAFASLLRNCSRQMGWTLAEQRSIKRPGQCPLRADGVLPDQFKLRHGVWEAKDSDDDLPAEAKKKFKAGYAQDNIIFQATLVRKLNDPYVKAIRWASDRIGDEGTGVVQWDRPQRFPKQPARRKIVSQKALFAGEIALKTSAV